MPPFDENTTLYVDERGDTVARQVRLSAPGAGEVTVEVAGSALGSEPGAEISGTVVDAGAAAVEWTGRRVVAPRVLPCGECDLCRRGRCFACAGRARRGPVARHVVLPARYLLSVEPPLWPGPASSGATALQGSSPTSTGAALEPGEAIALWQLAALADAVASPYAALVRAQVGPGDVCLVIGAGVRGRFAAKLARDLGAYVAILDADAASRERAASLADLLLDGEALDAGAARAALVAAATVAGRRTLEMKIIETTSTSAGRHRALSLLGTGDTAALLAGAASDGSSVLSRDDHAAPLVAVAEREAQIVGVHGCHPDLLPELAAMVVRGRLSLVGELVQRPFSSLAATQLELRRGQLHELAILTP